VDIKKLGRRDGGGHRAVGRAKAWSNRGQRVNAHIQDNGITVQRMLTKRLLPPLHTTITTEATPHSTVRHPRADSPTSAVNT
jgi:hypothetical protein